MMNLSNSNPWYICLTLNELRRIKTGFRFFKVIN